MAGIEVTMKVEALKKVERLRRGTGVVFTRFSKSEGRKAFNQHKAGLDADLKFYPPKRPQQTYIRTFELLKSWRSFVRTPKNGFVVTVDNRKRNISYPKFVVGTPDLRTRGGGKGQAWMHKGRWWIAGGVVKKHFNRMQDSYEINMINRLEEQTGFDVKRRSKLLR